MENLMTMKLIALFVISCFQFQGINGADSPKWPSVYTVSGVLQLPYAEINEPFTAYFDSKAKKSRIDYYGDLVITIQLAGSETYGQGYKVAPVTTEKYDNKNTCFFMNGTKDAPATMQSVLPDLTGFSNLGSETMKGTTCDKWQLVNVQGQKTNKYTIWLNPKDNIPVRYEMMGYDTLLGSHYDKYYLDYSNFETGAIPAKQFGVPDGLKCQDFPGPGAAEHRVEMNPMKEYVNNDDSHIHEMFHHFKKYHSKKYISDKHEAEKKTNFRHNVRYIHSKNRANLGYTLAVNHMADFSDFEFKMMRGRKHSTRYNGGLPFNKNEYNNVKIPEQVDWRLYGAVTPVKDQAVCGSCWSFGTTGTIEGTNFLTTGKLVRLSQQELMDCSWGQGNNACDGGEDFRAYDWIMKHGGIATAESYGPYLAQDGRCRRQNATIGAKITGFTNVTSGDAQALKIALAQKGPISIGIDASHKSLSFYANGVYYEPQCGNKPENLDHSVLAVGYGVMYGKPYWLVKNSWSTYWGNDGYVLMSQKDNNCGVTTDATYVIM